MSLKKKVIDEIINIEGGYVNDPSDSGGETNFGITKGTARAYGFKGKMKNLTREKAFEIYSKVFWDAIKLSEIEKLSHLIAEEVADTGVNMGPPRAGRFLQRSLNVLNNRGTIYPDLVVDGQVGGRTVGALAAYLRKRGSKGELILNKMLNCLQGSFYVTLAERREKDEKFVYGWYSHRID